jgi:mannosyltransferase
MRPALAEKTPAGPILWLVLVVALATLLDVLHLGDTSFWMDEALSATYARLPWSEFLALTAREEQNMSLYFVLLRAWIHLGESEFAIRTLSVLWAVAAVAAIYALGARLFDRRVGVLAALLLSVNGFHLRYAQEARGYSLLVFLVILCSVCFVKALQVPGRKHWAAYVLTSVLAVYTHFFALLVLAAQWASLPFMRSRALPWRALLGSALAMGLLIFPLGVLVVTGHQNVDWIPRSGLRDIYGLFLHLAGYAGRPALLAYAILCALALAEPLRRRPDSLSRATSPSPEELDERRELRGGGRSFERWPYVLLASWLVVPIALAWVVSLVKPAFVTRYLIVSLPPFVLLAAAGLGSTRRPVLAGALGVFLLLALPGIRFQYSKPFQEDWKGAAGHVLSRARADDALVFYIGSGRGPSTGTADGPSRPKVIPSRSCRRPEAKARFRRCCNRCRTASNAYGWCSPTKPPCRKEPPPANSSTSL